MDLQIRNAVYLEPLTGEEKNITVGIRGKKIETISFAEENTDGCAETYIDAAGAYLLPGMIDFHTHLFTGGSTFGINADLLLSSGTALAVDMGTAGSLSYENFHRMDLLPRTMKIKSYINLSPIGQPGAGIAEPLASEVIQKDKIRELIERYPKEILGIKIRLSQEIVGELGIRPLEQAIELAEQLGVPVCVHTTNPAAETAAIVKRLRPGDVYSHMYHGKGKTILAENGRVFEEFHKAQKRGVFLELGNGRMNFNFEVAEKAMKDGIFPDIISSDATARTYANAPDMKDLPYVMSKLWNMGMPLAKIFASVTETPARCLKLEKESGFLAVGRTADLTLLRPVKKYVSFSDSAGNVRYGDKMLVPEMTMIDGRIVYLQGTADLKRG